MTDRETQIFQWIKENPMISQQEIADRANIARSSVAVHISNLMKKGKIRGKGYVLQEEDYLTIIGAVAIDIFGVECGDLVNQISNPGRIRTSLGGVGRNISENISRLGKKVELITVFGDDVYGEEGQRICRNFDIGISHSITATGEETAKYLSINNQRGEMYTAVNDMRILDKLTPGYLQNKTQLINGGGFVIVDTNVSEEAIRFLADYCTVPIIATPVSIKKAEKLVGVLERIETITPNKEELAVLSGIQIDSERSLEYAVESLLSKGVKELFVSLGKEGMLYAAGDKRVRYPCLPSESVNTFGADDAFVSGIAWAKLESLPPEEQARAALAAVSICIEEEGAISMEMTLDNLRKRMG